MPRLGPAIVCLLALSPATALGQDTPLTPKQVYERCRDSVVSIEVESTTGKASGTGFFYEDARTIATALHVIDHAKRIMIRARNGDSWVPVAVQLDVKGDTALLRLGTDSGRKPIPSAPADKVSVGDPIFVIGDPLGLTGSLSTGVVGALRTEGDVPLVQITAPISHGSSGGPVLDASGRAIGIVSFTFTKGQNLNMAIGTSVAMALMASRKSYSMTELESYYAGESGRPNPPSPSSTAPSAKPEVVVKDLPSPGARWADYSGRQLLVGIVADPKRLGAYVKSAEKNSGLKVGWKIERVRTLSQEALTLVEHWADIEAFLKANATSTSVVVTGKTNKGVAFSSVVEVKVETRTKPQR